jgi:Uma2 family endonuclease
VIELVQQALSPLLPTGWRIRIQSAITTDDSEPEPDLAVVRGAVRDHIGRHPTPGETELVVEVTDTSVSRDRWKCRLYARAGIPQYWIVNLVANRLEVYGDPTGAVDEPKYGSQREYGAGDVVSLGWGDRQFGEIQVRDLLP